MTTRLVLTVETRNLVLGAPIPGALPRGPAGGQLEGTYPNPNVIGITETAGPDALDIGPISDGQWLKREGSEVVGTAPPELQDIKAGVVPAASFSPVGGVQKASVAFTTPYPDTNYSVTFDAGSLSGYGLRYESKTASGFVVNLGTVSLSGLVEISWKTAANGE